VLVVGLLVALPIGLPILGAGLSSLAGPPMERVWGLPASLILIIPGAFLCVLPVCGVIALFKARDTEYHFLGSQRKVSVRDRHGERQEIPFSDIVKAEQSSSSSHDEPTTYGLRLKLRGFNRTVPMSQLSGSGDMTAELAERINRFLEAHCGPTPEALPKADSKKVERPEPIPVVTPENKRSKVCPSCGRDLTLYAIKCRFCKAAVE